MSLVRSQSVLAGFVVIIIILRAFHKFIVSSGVQTLIDELETVKASSGLVKKAIQCAK